MGRIRSIKPEFTMDEDLSTTDAETNLFAVGTICYADDEGYFNANPGLMQAAIFPLRKTTKTVPEMLAELVKVGFLRLGVSPDGKRWGHVRNFKTHQRVNRPTPSKILPLPIKWEASPKAHGGLTEGSLLEGKQEVGSEEERNGCAIVSDDLEPEMLPTILAETLKISVGYGPGSARDAIQDVAAAEKKAGRLMRDLVAEMECAWQFYQHEKPGLRITWGAAKFFGEGHWRDPTSWPRKSAQGSSFSPQADREAFLATMSDEELMP